MNGRGFSLIELVVVMSIIAILSSIVALNWNRMTIKSKVEGQIKAVHADLMRIRLEALYGKKERRVEFAGKVFKIYSSSFQTSDPQESKTFNFDFSFTRGDYIFNTSGLASGYEGSVCVDPYGNLAIANDAYVDSLVITDGRISLGKRTGDGCNSNDITKR